MTSKLTKQRIQNLEASESEYVEWDSVVPGMGIRVRTSGRKTYIFTYRVRGQKSGRQRKMTLGKADAIGLEDARLMARELCLAVARGDDPARRALQAEEPVLFEKIANRFLDEHVKLKRSQATLSNYRHFVDHYLVPEIGNIPLAAISRSDLIKMQNHRSATPTSANRALAVFGAIHTYAIKSELIPDAPSPTRGVEKFKETSRERFLSQDEMARLGAALQKAETVGITWQIKASKATRKHVAKANTSTLIDPHASTAIKLLILTGCRLREILNLEWRDVDLPNGLLNLRLTKTGKRTVFLCGPAISLLDGQPRLGPFVFPGKDMARPRHDLKRPWAAIIREAELPEVRLHDLRHTFASVGAMSGMGLPIVSKLLGHADTRMTEKYAHFASDPIRKASEQVGVEIWGHIQPTNNKE